MRRAGTWLVLVFGLAGCAETAHERVRDYNWDGVQLYQCGNVAAAAESFQAALQLDPENPVLHYNLGECYAQLGQTAKAEQMYRSCLDRAPNHADCRHALAVHLVKQGRWAEASTMVQTWLASQPKLAAAYAADGWLWAQSGDLPRAQARLQQALDLDPHDPRALSELAQLYETMNRPDRAAAIYERILERHPQNFAAARRLDELRARGVGRPIPD